MPISRTQRIVATGAAALGIALGAAGITAAATTGTNGGDSPDRADVAYESSITADPGATPSGLATITETDASAAAVAATGGTAGKVELENEHGNVVYGVEITLTDGSRLDVTVDAGNATVLDREADDDNEHGDQHEDGETNDDHGTANGDTD